MKLPLNNHQKEGVTYAKATGMAFEVKLEGPPHRMEYWLNVHSLNRNYLLDQWELFKTDFEELQKKRNPTLF